ncbi:MAG: AEC family transporter [Clostridia bacterium]|nr:AEC family transporter [Clostridia bacterium]
MGFSIALANVLTTLFYIIPGFTICKMRKALPNHLPTLSAVLIYIGTPFLEINMFMSLDYSRETSLKMLLFFVISILLQGIFMLFIYFIVTKKHPDKKYKIISTGSVMGNVGFFGLPLMKALFPNNPEISCYVAMYMVGMNLLVFTMGSYCITGEKKYISLRSALFNPTTFGMLFALPIYFFGLGKYIPSMLANAINIMGSMTTPLCMFILGIRLANTSLKNLISKPVVFLIAAMKLIAFPLFCFVTLYFIPLDFTFKACLIVLAGTPCAAIIQSLSEMYDSQAELSANCIMITTLLCFMTLPLFAMIVT